MASGDITFGFASASSQGRLIQIAATATPGTLIHNAIGGTTDLELLEVWAVNNHTASVELTIEFGGTGSGDIVVVTLASKRGPVLVVPGWYLHNGLAVRGFASVGSVVNVAVRRAVYAG